MADTPTTEAGRALLAKATPNPRILQDILAIEREAAAQAEARVPSIEQLAEALQRSEADPSSYSEPEPYWLAYATNLRAALTPPASEAKWKYPDLGGLRMGNQASDE